MIAYLYAITKRIVLDSVNIYLELIRIEDSLWCFEVLII